MRIAVLGAGAWGSALAISLSRRHPVFLWTRARQDAERLTTQRESRYLPDCRIPDGVTIGSDLAEATGCELLIAATATAGLHEVATALGARQHAPRLLWACKGFDTESRRLPHEVVRDAIPGARQVGVLSGPSFALEVARSLPTALVVASRDAAFAAEAAAALNSTRLRVYSSDDVMGVELGGAVKNVIAIAAGIADGLALGRNARAALVTRGLAEIVRLGAALGGQPETFMGLTGVGDLVLTCTGDLSRNRAVGMALAQGTDLKTALAQLGHVAEGVHSARAVRELAEAKGVEMPITEAVCRVLYERRSPQEALEALLARSPRSEL
jgi:glycerol-3-phosphate dehydrogenase (NAD(P)+)